MIENTVTARKLWHTYSVKITLPFIGQLKGRAGPGRVSGVP